MGGREDPRTREVFEIHGARQILVVRAIHAESLIREEYGIQEESQIQGELQIQEVLQIRENPPMAGN